MTDMHLEKPPKYENIGFDESWTEEFDSNPYIKDEHQISREALSEKYTESSVQVIDADTSFEEAQKAVDMGVADEDGRFLIFQCKHCKILFDHSKRFLIHYKWHWYGRPKEPKRVRLSTRVRTQTKPAAECEDESDHTCNICHQNYQSKGSLKNHRARVHFAHPKECPVCKKIFQNSTYLKSHMNTHTEEKKYMCDECPKSFKFLHSLLRHQPSHKEKSFPCDKCEKSFGSELLLKIHGKTHEKALKGTSYQCSYCAKGFYNAYSLHVHERTHRGEKPFKCSICNSSYGTNSSLQRHLKVSHSGVKPYECSVCRRSFLTETIRDRHTARAHQQVDDIHLSVLNEHVDDIRPKRLRKTRDLAKIKRKKIRRDPEVSPPSEELSEVTGLNLTSSASQMALPAVSPHEQTTLEHTVEQVTQIHNPPVAFGSHMVHPSLQDRLQSIHRRMTSANLISHQPFPSQSNQ